MTKKNIIKELKNKPIHTPAWIRQLDYFKNRDQIHQTIKKRRLNINHNLYQEKIVDSTLFGLKGQDFYWEKQANPHIKKVKKYLNRHVFLRESVVQDLKKIDNLLREFNLCLFLKNGYRHPKVQEAAIKMYKAIDAGNTDRFIKNKNTNKNHPYTHTTGAAFDLVIYDLKTKQPLVFFDSKAKGDNQKITSFYYEDKKRLTNIEKDIRNNRRLLFNLLCTDCLLTEKKIFVSHPFEHWHFSRGDQLARFWSSSKNLAYYGQVKFKLNVK